jgi:hypothetical protein
MIDLEIEARDICRFWAKKIGVGFHLDTAASDYSPPLPKTMQRALHVDLRRLWEIGELTGLDLYAVALIAMETEGVI